MWTTEFDYPFGDGDYVGAYDMLYIEEQSAYFVIGGFSGSNLATIAKFENSVWSFAGNLKWARNVSFCSFF